MKAQETRRGGQHLARERGANDVESVPVEALPLDEIQGGPLADRLSDESRRNLAEACIANGLRI